MSVSNYRPRIVIDVSEEQYRALKQFLPWGVQNEVFRTLIDDLIAVLEEHGGAALGMILTKQLKMRELSSSLKDLPKTSKG